MAKLNLGNVGLNKIKYFSYRHISILDTIFHM